MDQTATAPVVVRDVSLKAARLRNVNLVDTLRHLVFDTDAWVRRTALGEPHAFHRVGLRISTKTYAPNWGIPGGVSEENESPRASCEREVAEELGIRVRMQRLLAIDHRAATSLRPEYVRFLRDGGTLTGDQIASIRLQESEVDAWEFSTLGDARAKLSESLVDIVTAGLGATGAVSLEEGR